MPAGYARLRTVCANEWNLSAEAAEGIRAEKKTERANSTLSNPPAFYSVFPLC
jgi:hypothetical protein